MFASRTMEFNSNVVEVLERETCDYSKWLKILPEISVFFFFFLAVGIKVYRTCTMKRPFRKFLVILLDFHSVQADCNYVGYLYSIVVPFGAR